MVGSRAFLALCFWVHFILLIQNTTKIVEGNDPNDVKRVLYFKIKASLTNINADGQGLSWCLTRDRVLRRQFGLGVKNAYRIKFDRNESQALQLALLLISGDVATNPGPCQRRSGRNGIVRNLSQIQSQSSPVTSLSTTTHDIFSSLELPLKGLNFCHYNVCSLTNKLDEIKLLLSSLSDRRKSKPNLILGISESFLDGSWSNASLAVDNFSTFRADRDGKKGGGLLVYVPAHLPVRRRFDLEMVGVECIWFELNFPHSRPCLFSFVYRPPSSHASYLDLLDSMLTKADSLQDNQILILGDFNYNLLDKSSNSIRFLNIFQSFNYKQLITVPTRPVSGSLLDHIFVTHQDNVMKSGTLPITLSDHLPVFVNWKSRSNTAVMSGHKPILFRSLRNFSVDKFLSDLQCIPWNTLDMFTDPNDTLEQWYCLFNNVLNLHAPFKKRRVKRQYTPEWFTAEISEAIMQRNNLHSLAVLNNTNHSWHEYRVARNRVVHLIRSAKRSFYRDSINSNLDDPKNLWRIIRNIAPSKSLNLPSHLVVGENTYDDSIDIANLFNEYFANITTSVQLNSPPTSPNWEYLFDFVNTKLPNGVLFDIPPVTEEFVLLSLQRLPLGKSAGLDGLNGYFLKISAPLIAPSLTLIFNASIVSGIFPDLWKVAKVCPLFKDGALFDRSNFRPISVLAIISKILERHIHSSYYQFLVDHELLSDSQFGFRRFRSCELAVTELSDMILKNMDTKLLNGLLLIDLKKAFDLVDHSTLIFKLRAYGCSTSTIQWFQSYLTGRSQKTIFKGTLSDTLPITVGIPQGSILGPLFFVLFINDLPLYMSNSSLSSSISSSDFNLIMFADDTTILTSGSSISDVSSKLNLVAKNVSDWADQNRMTLNTSKTKCMLITTPHKYRRLSSSSLNIVISESPIDQVEHTAVLGVELDSYLTWDHHVNNICSKISSRLFLLRRIKPFLTYDCTLRFYNSCVHTHFIYCSISWGNCSHTQLLRLLRLQKRAARILLDADFTQPSLSLFSKLKWVPISDLIKCRKLQLLFSVLLNPDAPSCFKKKFQCLSVRRSAVGCPTRASAFDLMVPHPRTNSLKRTYGYSAAVLFNALDTEFKQLVNISSPFLLNSRLLAIKHKLRALFFPRLLLCDHLEQLICFNCRFLLFCNCVKR